MFRIENVSITQNIKPIFDSQNTQITKAWEHCMRSECDDVLKILNTLTTSSWETELLRLCVNGMILYQAQQFQESFKVFEKLFDLYFKHKGPWTILEQLQMDWVKKQFGETAYKISSQAYSELTHRFAAISFADESPLSLSDKSQRLLNQGKLKEAEAKCEEALKLLESNANHYPTEIINQIEADSINILITTKNFLAKFEEADELIEKLFSETIFDVRLKVNLIRKRGEVQLFLGNFKEADLCFDQCIQLLQDSSDLPLKFTTYLRQALSYQRNKLFSLALQTYQKMISIKDNQLNANEKTILQWNVGALIYRMDKEKFALEDPMELKTILAFLNVSENLLQDAYQNIQGKLPQLLLKPTWEKIGRHLENTKESSEIIAYIPYGYDTIYPKMQKMHEINSLPR